MPTKNTAGVDQQLIRDLAGILEETNLTEIEVERGDMRVKVARQSAAPPVQQSQPAAAVQQPQKRAEPTQGETSEPLSDVSKNAVLAPMVGTAYRASAPGAPPLVEVGQSVREGQTLLIIEAMKTMNQIPAPRAGEIKAILFDDAQPVEYGEPLVVIE